MLTAANRAAAEAKKTEGPQYLRRPNAAYCMMAVNVAGSWQSQLGRPLIYLLTSHR